MCIFDFSLRKPADSYWFKMSCVSCLVFICVHCFFLKIMKLYNDICFVCMNRLYFCRNFFLVDWCHKLLKNTTDLFFFKEKTLCIFCKVIYESIEKNIYFTTYFYKWVTNILKFYEVLFCTYCKGLLCLQKTVITLIFLHICIKLSQH